MGGATAQSVDIWVDDRDLLVKKVERGRTETGELTQTAYYSDYGVRVLAERPCGRGHGGLQGTAGVTGKLKPGRRRNHKIVRTVSATLASLSQTNAVERRCDSCAPHAPVRTLNPVGGYR